MGLFGKKEAAPVIEVQEPEVVEQAPVQQATVIGKSASFVGDFTTAEDLCINGAVKGNIDSSVTVYINEGGLHSGTANVDTMVIRGTADADIICNGTTRIESTGVLTGNLRTCHLVTEEGSAMDGNLQLKRKATEPAPIAAAPAPAEDAPAEA